MHAWVPRLWRMNHTVQCSARFFIRARRTAGCRPDFRLAQASKTAYNGGSKGYDRLRLISAGVQFERDNGYCNVNGRTMPFNSFLVQELQKLVGSNEEVAADMNRILPTVREYEVLSIDTRKQILQDVENIITRLQDPAVNDTTRTAKSTRNAQSTESQWGTDLGDKVNHGSSSFASDKTIHSSHILQDGSPLGLLDGYYPIPGSTFPEDEGVWEAQMAEYERDVPQQSEPLSDQSESSTVLNNRFILHRDPILKDDSVVAIGLDCETNSFHGPILELAAMNYNTGEVWKSLINPGDIKFERAAYEIHKISPEMVQAPEVPSSEEACKEFLSWLKQQAGGKEVALLGYNSKKFDLPLIKKEFTAAGIDFPGQWYYLDVLLWARAEKAVSAFKSKNYKLVSLRDALEIQVEGDAHRAEVDTIAMGHVVPELLKLRPPDKRDLASVLLDGGTHSGRFSTLFEEGEGGGQVKAMPSNDWKQAPVYPTGKVTSSKPVVKKTIAETPAVIAPKPMQPPTSSPGQSERELLLQSTDSANFWTKSEKINLKQAGFNTVLQVAHYFPRDYNVYASSLSPDRIGSLVALAAQIEEISIVMRPQMCLMSVSAVTQDGMRLLWTSFYKGSRGMYFAHGLAKKYPEGTSVVVRGKLRSIDGVCISLGLPVELTYDASGGVVDKVIPIYSARSPLKAEAFGGTGFQDGIISRLMKELEVCKHDFEFIPEDVRASQGLTGWYDAAHAVHIPDTKEAQETARKRFVFQLLQLAKRYMMTRKLRSDGLRISKHKLMKEAMKVLPFTLTKGQDDTLKDILKDLDSTIPMLRLLQGDVGSGKTAIAFMAMLAAVGSGYQACMMAPVTVLAHQHLKNLRKLISNLPGNMRPRVEILTGSVKTSERRRVMAGLESGEIDVLIGTHSLYNQGIVWKNLGFVAIDEQQRFGVEQREKLHKGQKKVPHTLLMSATPIPRTLALTLHGSLDVSQLKDMPPGREPVSTEIVFEKKKRDMKKMYSEAKKELDAGGRVFVVYALIDCSVSDIMVNVKSVQEEFNNFKKSKTFGDHALGFLHGRMSDAEKSEKMEQFSNGSVPVLVSTTVIEVGMDVPEASVMIVNNAERYGLAQLHQLRGRVGRGNRASKCFLITRGGELVLERLGVLASSNDGLEIAQEDLRIRGPGDLLGSKQHGHMGLFSVTAEELLDDLKVVETSRAEAQKILEKNDYEIPEQLLKVLQAQGFPQPQDFDLQ